MRYRYRVVSGTRIISEPLTFPKARQVLIGCRVYGDPKAELERIAATKTGKRYWRHRRYGWVRIWWMYPLRQQDLDRFV